MSIKFVVWFVLVFVLLSGVFATNHSEWYDKDPLDWNLMPEGFIDWSKIVDWTQFPDSAVSRVTGIYINEIPGGTLGRKWDAISDKSTITAETLNGVLTARVTEGGIDLTGIDTSAIKNVISEKHMQFEIDIKSNEIKYDGKTLTDSNGASYNLETLSAKNSQTLFVDEDGVVRFGKKPVESEDTTQADKPKTNEIEEDSSEIPSLNLEAVTGVTENKPFRMYLSEPTEIIAADGQTLYVQGYIAYDGNNIVVENGANENIATIQSRQILEGNMKITTLTITATDASVSVNPKPYQPTKNAVYFNMNEDKILPLDITVGGAGYSVSYIDKKSSEEINIELHKNKPSLIFISDNSDVTVKTNEGRIIVGSWFVDPDGKAKLRPNMSKLSIPNKLTIVKQKNRPFDQEYNAVTRNDEKDFDGKISLGNMFINITKTTTNEDIREQILAKQTNDGIKNQPDSTQINNFMVNVYGMDLDDLKEHAGANFAQFPPDSGGRLDNIDSQGNHFVTYADGDGKLFSIAITDTNSDSKISKTEFEAALKKYADENEIDLNSAERTFSSNIRMNDVQKTIFSVGSGGGGLDEVSDSYTNAGVGNIGDGTYLTPGVIAVADDNPWDLETGDVIKGDDGFVYIVADVYSRELNNNRVDVYMASDNSEGQYDRTKNGPDGFTLIYKKAMAISGSTTPADIRKTLTKYGKYPPGESAAETIIRTGKLESVSNAYPDKNVDIKRKISLSANSVSQSSKYATSSYDTIESQSSIDALANQLGVDLGTYEEMNSFASAPPIPDPFSTPGTSESTVMITVANQNSVSLVQIQKNYNYWHKLANGNLRNTPGSYQKTLAYCARQPNCDATKLGGSITIRDKVRDGQMAENQIAKELTEIGLTTLAGQDGSTNIAVRRPSESPTVTVAGHKPKIAVTLEEANKYVSAVGGANPSDELIKLAYETATITREKPTCISPTSSYCSRFASNYQLILGNYGLPRHNANRLDDLYAETKSGTVRRISQYKADTLKNGQIIVQNYGEHGHASTVMKDPETNINYIVDLYKLQDEPKTRIRIRPTNAITDLQRKNYLVNVITPSQTQLAQN